MSKEERKQKRREKKTKKKLQRLSAAHDYRPAYGCRDKEEHRRTEGQQSERQAQSEQKGRSVCSRYQQQRTKTKKQKQNQQQRQQKAKSDLKRKKKVSRCCYADDFQRSCHRQQQQAQQELQ